MNRSSFEVIDGGRVDRKPPSRADIDNAARRRLFNGVPMSTLAWKLGVKQERIADRENEIMFERGYKAGLLAGRGLRPPMENPPAMAKREAA